MANGEYGVVATVSTKRAQPLALFDMDGTLFDYEGQLRRDLEKIKSPEEVYPEDLWEERIPWVKARMDLIKSQVNWWRDLPLLANGLELINVTSKMGFNCHILTKGPAEKHRAWAEKVECIRLHSLDGDIPHVGIDIVGTMYGEEPAMPKSGRYGHVLVDDYPDYVEAWLEYRPRGLAILPIQSYNKDFKHPNAIHYDGSMGSLARVKAHLAAVLKRKSGEHWKDYLSWEE